jgi:hypothetical protein
MRSPIPRTARSRRASAWLLGSRVRILLRAWTYVSCFLVNDQLDAQFFSMYLFQFSTCFEKPRAHHQENQLYQHNIWYMSLFVDNRFVCRSEMNFPTCARNGRGYSKHVETWNKYIEKNCASSWSFTKNHNKIHGKKIYSFLRFLRCAGSGLGEEVLTRSEKPYRLNVWSGNLNNEEAWARLGLLPKYI